MATVTKRCGCAQGVEEPQGKRTVWLKCSHAWVVRWQQDGRQAEASYPAHERREADAKAKVVESAKVTRSGVDPAGSKTALGTLVDEWISDRPGPDSTRRAYASVVRSWLPRGLVRRPVSAIRREDIQRVLREMRGQVGTSRQATMYLVLNGVMREAVRRRWIHENPCAEITPPKGAQDKDFIVPTATQFRAIEAAMPDDWALSIWLMYGCGLRPGEALGVHKSGVRGTRLRIHEQLLAWPNDTFGPLKHRPARAAHEVPLPPTLLAKIEEHIDTWGTVGGYLFRGNRPEEPRRKYTYPTRQAWREAFMRGVRRAGLPEHFTPHWLRHAFATEHLLRGTSLLTVSRWLNHRSIQTTVDTYGHLVPGEWSRGLDLMDGSLGELMDSSGVEPEPPGTDGN